MQSSNVLRWLAGASLVLAALACTLSPSASTPADNPKSSPSTAPTSAETKQSQAPTLASTQADLNPPPAQPSAASAEVSASVSFLHGATIQLDNSHGDHITLIIPPLAVSPTVTITLTALDTPPENPIASNFFPGIRLEPAGLSLRRPAHLTVSPNQPQPNPAAILFYLNQSDLVLPLGVQEMSANSIQAGVLHFSTILGGEPTLAEAKDQMEAAANQPPTNATGWQNETDTIGGLVQWNQILNTLGDSGAGEQSINQARLRLENELACLMDINCFPVPIEQCGDYLQMLLRYFEQATLLGIDENSAGMQYLQGELTRVLNQCTNRFELEYNHVQTAEESGFTNRIQVSGRVLFYAPIYGVFDLGEPLQLQGAGSVPVTMSGEGGDCTISGSGSNDVTISGEIVADDQGTPWMEINSDEIWYAAMQATVTCDQNSQEIPISPMAATHKIRLLLEDGYVYTQPHEQGMGSYTWTLHVLHLW